jgi:hypothetical protein
MRVWISFARIISKLKSCALEYVITCFISELSTPLTLITFKNQISYALTLTSSIALI